MKATAVDKKPYYPMLLSNGQDGILVDYSGSNFVSCNGHTHHEQPLGAATGWYKGTSRMQIADSTSLIASSGVQVILFQAPTEPEYYEQSLDEKTGILTTKLVFAKKLHIQVESFLTKDGLWCEQVRILRCPKDWKPQIGYLTLRAYSGYSWLNLAVDPGMNDLQTDGNQMSFSYQIKDKKGTYAIWTSQAFIDVQTRCNTITKELNGCTLMLGEFAQGDTVSRVTTCVDETEINDLQAEFARRKNLAALGYEQLKRQHVSAWFNENAATVTLPNKDVQAVYDMGQYAIRASQNGESGALCLGLLPHLWGGGLYCSYDAYFTLHALLSSGHLREVEVYKNFLYAQGDVGKQALASIGLDGVAFTGWTNCKGEFCRSGIPLTEWFLKEKPMFACCEVHNLYQVWSRTGKQTDEKLINLLKGFVVFAKQALLLEQNGEYYLKNIKAGTEGGFDVETDTFTVILLAQAMLKIAEILQDTEYDKIGESLLKSLSVNYTKDGYLLPFKDASYLGGGIQMDGYIFSLPKGIDIKNVDKVLAVGKRPYGYDFDQLSETYRHWPWIDGRAAICYAHAKQPKKAFRHVRNLANGASSLGILPEKIRLDGLAINYWYTSAIALAVWAVNQAFAYLEGDTVYLCYGFTKKWQNFSCENVRIENGLSVSICIVNGKLQKLVIDNPFEQAQTFNLSLNDEFTAENLPATCTLQGKSQFIFERG